MRVIHRVPFSPPRQETEFFRQLVFDNLTRGLKYLLDALPDMGLALPDRQTSNSSRPWRTCAMGRGV
ncbi:hypothetical protein DFH09DRAFT_1121413, partial [Mycena vulgaris]